MSLIEKHGVMVEPNRVRASDFVRQRNVREGSNSYFGGSWAELEMLVENNFSNFVPGTGSVNNDVRLVHVPAENFFTSVARITDENAHLIETVTSIRREGENSYTHRILRGKKLPAKDVQIVVYRADVLAQDDGRSTDAEWEIVSINAGPGYRVPMAPSTMKRNSNHEAGGTFRRYTQAEWDEAYEFWDSHVSVWED